MCCACVCLNTRVHIPGGQSLKGFADAVSAIITKSQKPLAPARKKEGKKGHCHSGSLTGARGLAELASCVCRGLDHTEAGEGVLAPTLGRRASPQLHHLSPCPPVPVVRDTFGGAPSCGELTQGLGGWCAHVENSWERRLESCLRDESEEPQVRGFGLVWRPRLVFPSVVR